MIESFTSAIGPNKVVSDAQALRAYDDDYSEADRITPVVALLPTTVEEVQAIVRIANELRVPLTPRVAGTNVGGLAIPPPGGAVIDLRNMNRILSVNVDDMVAVIEPGVTQQQLHDHLQDERIPLTVGYSLGPKRSSILANLTLDGLTNRSLKYGAMGDWASGFEVVLADGSVVKTGAWALSDVPFARSPFPDLTGLFVGWQGTTGIVTKAALHLVPKHALNERLFLLCYSIHGAYELMRRLCKLEICDDIAGLSWPTGKMMLGVRKPHPIPNVGEPTFFLYADLTANDHEEMSYKKHALGRVVEDLRAEGEAFEHPLDVPSLVALDPRFSRFASFPTDLDFLTERGGLTWVGTYGPLSRFDETAQRGVDIMVRHGFAPAIVSRAMTGGHFGVLRFLALFEREDSAGIEAVKAMNLELLRAVTEAGFVMYKTPPWAMRELLPRLDPGMVELMRRTRAMLDPSGILNPGKLPLGA